ncbi:hypothetical protein JW992_07445 [candidate division KSB1 bacterium]|nr:hypothetical protein [candidate division KSB1 bacterium]
MILKVPSLHRKKKLVTTVILIALFLVAFCPIEFPRSIKATARFYPTRQWILAHDGGGQLTAFITDYRSGVGTAYRSTLFERGDEVEFSLVPWIRAGAFVQKNDSLGSLVCNSLEWQRLALERELVLARNELAVHSTGAKGDVQRLAKERLALARAEAEKQEKITRRLQELLAKNHVAEQEVQIARDDLKSRQIEVHIREAELAVLQSGEKNEILEQSRATVQRLEKESEFINQQIASLKRIAAPFAGQIERSFASDTLLILSETGTSVAIMPILQRDARAIRAGLQVNFSGQNDVPIWQGVILQKEPGLHLISGKPCRMVLALVEHEPEQLLSGMFVQAKISCDPLPLRLLILDYLGKHLKK